jgi:hypothetical protein
MTKEKDIIIYDLKIKMKSGSYISLLDNISTLDLAVAKAKDFLSEEDEKVYSVQVWETKGGMITSLVHEEK